MRSILYCDKESKYTMQELRELEKLKKMEEREEWRRRERIKQSDRNIGEIFRKTNKMMLE